MQSNDMRQTNRLLREQVRLQRQQNRRLGCLSGVVFTLLFGVFYWMWLTFRMLGQLVWRSGAVVWAWLILASVWTWRGSVWTAGQLVTLARAVYHRIRPAA